MELETNMRAIRDALATIVTNLDEILGQFSTVSPSDAEHVQSLQRTKAIEWVLNQHRGQSLSPVQIWSELQALGRSDPKMEVQVTTYDLWERSRIGKSGRGQYHAL